MSPLRHPRPTRYSARKGAVVGHNLGGYYNRPLYLAHTNAFVLAGDRPIIRFGSGETLHGTFGLGVVRGRTSKWLDAFSDLTLEYRAAHVTWLARDRSFPGLAVKLEVVGEDLAAGFAVRLSVEGARASDRLVWMYGGAQIFPDKPLNWELDPHRTPRLIPDSFDPVRCVGNRVQVDEQTFSVAPAQATAGVAVGHCDAGGKLRVADAAQFESPAKLAASTAGMHPLVVGVGP